MKARLLAILPILALLTACGVAHATAQPMHSPTLITSTPPQVLTVTDNPYGIPTPNPVDLKVSCSIGSAYGIPEYTVTFDNTSPYQMNVRRYVVRFNIRNGSKVDVETSANLGIPPETSNPFTWMIPGEFTYQEVNSVGTVVTGCKVTNWASQ